MAHITLSADGTLTLDFKGKYSVADLGHSVFMSQLTVEVLD